ncbi:MAG: enhanced intracellular survival protein Eis [Candidatus Thorarchaeota archaeon]
MKWTLTGSPMVTKVNFREASPDDKTTVRNILIYAFEGHRNRYGDPEEKRDLELPYQIVDYLLEDENGDIIATLGVIEFNQRIRGTWVKMAGITAVACRPEYRRKSYMTRLFLNAFVQLNQQEFLVSVLYPFTFAFYEKLGYGQADEILTHTIKTTEIIKRPTPNRMITEDFDPNFKRCQPLYRKLSEKLEGLVERPPYVWEKLYGWNWTNGGFQFICQDLEGNDLGYIITRFERKSPFNPFSFLEVREIVYFDSETKQALLNFLADHDSQREYIKIAPYDQNYLPFLKTPRMKENYLIANSMLRIINIESLVPLLKYPEEVSTSVTLELKDPHCSWQNKTLTVQIENGRGIITTTPSDEKLLLGVKELSQVVVGFRSPQELAEAGAIKGSQEALERLGKIFPKQTTYFRDYF